MPKKVLIIDDDHSFRAFERAALERMDYIVTEASDGAIGMNLIWEQEFDLVVMDIFMPNQEGIETLRQIRKSLPNLPVITISGGGAVHNYLPMRTAKIMGANKVMEKPVTMNAFLKAVNDLLLKAA